MDNLPPFPSCVTFASGIFVHLRDYKELRDAATQQITLLESTLKISTTMNTQHKVECSWCNRESGATSKPGTSHGICPSHKAQLLSEYKRDHEAQDVAKTFSDLERAREYQMPSPVRNDVLEAAWNAPEPTVWSALKWVGFGVLCGLGATLMVLAMAWEGLP